MFKGPLTRPWCVLCQLDVDVIPVSGHPPETFSVDDAAVGRVHDDGINGQLLGVSLKVLGDLVVWNDILDQKKNRYGMKHSASLVDDLQEIIEKVSGFSSGARRCCANAGKIRAGWSGCDQNGDC